jgi:RNA polymerase sigma-70 factor (ECF subfamily)
MFAFRKVRRSPLKAPALQSLGMSRDEDAALLEQLRAGEEEAFVVLVKRYHHRLTRLALTFVPSPEMAEDVAQETWLAVFRGVGKFEGRSSLRTWLFQICANRARSLASREQRLAAMGRPELAVDPGRCDPGAGWSSPSQHWADAVDDSLEADELALHVRRAIAELPQLQRQVVTLRDIEGLPSLKVCEVLSLSGPNQRVLLHRGRSRIRRTLEEVTQQ